jgi:hypothetical protein
MVSLVVSCILAVATGQVAAAPPATGADEERKKLEEQIAKELGGGPGQAAPVVPSAAGQGSAAAPAGGSALARVLLLPDISAIGDFALAFDTLRPDQLAPESGPVIPAHRLTPVLQEVELALQAVVDPYARADIFLTIDEQGIEVEEAFLTTLSLPAGLQAKAGTFRSPFGRLNLLHRHVWDFVDTPASFQRLVGSDGLKGPGVDLSWLAPLPWFAELHLDYQSTVPGFSATGSLTGLARLLQYFELSDATTLGVGLSAGALSQNAPSAWRDLGGADVYLRLRPPAGRAYVAFQGEVYARRYRGAVDPTDPTVTGDGTRVGGYGQAVWRWSPYFMAGVRYDQGPAGSSWPSGTQREVALLGGWLPSEFMRLRLQASGTRLPGGVNGYGGYLSLEFTIGAHGAHPF